MIATKSGALKSSSPIQLLQLCICCYCEVLQVAMGPFTLLKLLLSLHLITTTRADFSFTLNIFSHTTSGSCLGDDLTGDCETFLPSFCLRGPRQDRSTSTTDCPLGRNTNSLDESVNSGIRVITSNRPWPVSEMYS